jgi:ketosteroid isomerase-like protein
MSENFATIHFTRSMADDLDVVRSTPWAKDENGIEKQFRSEFAECIDNSKLTIEELKWVQAGDTYMYVTRLDLDGTNQNDPDAVLDHLVATLQQPYDLELAGGHFEIETITLGGVTFDTAELLAARDPSPKM